MSTIYIHYLPAEEQKWHSNKAASHPGIGRTVAEARENACYWANQAPWTRTVPVSRAPRYAIDAAVNARRAPCVACDGPRHTEACVDRFGNVTPEAEARRRAWEAADYPAVYQDGDPVGGW